MYETTLDSFEFDRSTVVGASLLAAVAILALSVGSLDVLDAAYYLTNGNSETTAGVMAGSAAVSSGAIGGTAYAGASAAAIAGATATGVGAVLVAGA